MPARCARRPITPSARADQHARGTLTVQHCAGARHSGRNDGGGVPLRPCQRPKGRHPEPPDHRDYGDTGWREKVSTLPPGDRPRARWHPPAHRGRSKLPKPPSCRRPAPHGSGPPAARRSKTDQEGAGRDVGIPRARKSSITCPVTALEVWLQEREVFEPSRGLADVPGTEARWRADRFRLTDLAATPEPPTQRWRPGFKSAKFLNPAEGLADVPGTEARWRADRFRLTDLASER
jgi:hypothetical protein